MVNAIALERLPRTVLARGKRVIYGYIRFICSKCGAEKDATEFHRRGQDAAVNGRSVRAWCLKCTRERQRLYARARYVPKGVSRG